MFKTFILYQYRTIGVWIQILIGMIIELEVTRYMASYIGHYQVCSIAIYQKDHVTRMVSDINVRISGSVIYQLLAFFFCIRGWFCLRSRDFINCWQYGTVNSTCII